MYALLLTAIVSLGYLLAAANAVLYPGVVSNNLAGFDTRLLLLILPILTYFFHQKQKSAVTALFWNVHKKATIPVLIFAAIAITTEYLTYPNFVYNAVHIDFVWLYYFAITFLSVTAAALSGSWYAKHWRWAVVLIPGVILLYLKTMQLADSGFFRLLIHEDGTVENLQVLCFSAASLLSALIARQHWRKNMLVAILFACAAFGFLIITAEEISWGQRIFNVATPAAIAEENLQGEINIHNNSSIFGYVYRAYFLIGLYGVLTAIARPLLLRKFSRYAHLLPLFLPGWQYLGYFGFALIYNADRLYFRPHIIGEKLWEEPMELVLILGIALFLYYGYRFSRNRPY